MVERESRRSAGEGRREGVRIDVGSLEDFKERTLRIVSVSETEVGIARWDGDQVYALRNVCPHQGGPVCRGRFGPQVVARDGLPGTLDINERRPVIRCSWHGWEFDVRSGAAVVAGSRYKVRTYPVRIEGDRILVDLEHNKPVAAGQSPLRQNPEREE